MDSLMRNKVVKELNRMITKDNFCDVDAEEYLYASLSQPPIKVISKNDSEDNLEWTVECPNCKKNVIYGEQIYMLSGYIYCDNKGCRDSLLENTPYLKEKYK